MDKCAKTALQRVNNFRKKAIRYAILVPIALVFLIPIVSIAWFWNPKNLYKDFFEYLQTDQSLGIFD